MSLFRIVSWRRPSDKLPDVEDFVDLLIVPKSSGNHLNVEIGCYLGGNEWEYKHSSPSFTSDSVAYWAYIPEPPNEEGLEAIASWMRNKGRTND